MQPYKLKKHFVRQSTFMEDGDSRIPSELYSQQNEAPELSSFPYPLPSLKSDYICFAEGQNGVMWYAGKSGVTRYDKDAEREEDIVMYFCSYRHLPSNNILSILSDGDNGLWVRTDDGVAHIEMKMMSANEKANVLLEETNKYVMRRGMVSQRDLRKPRDFSSRFPYAACDNDGTFTAGHAIGEMYHYAVMKKELGENNPETLKALKDATHACEACLLLMYIHGRDEGFISRSYHLIDEPVPDDGIFFKRNGKTAVCIDTTESRKKNRIGEVAPCTLPVPDRLAALYRSLGYTDDDIIYKADTSSDEVTHHFLQMKIAHDILGAQDIELDEIIKDACRRTTKHIIDGGFEFLEHSGKPTTWARWSKKYFDSDVGYVDAPLNCAEMLMYLKVTMYITGETGIWLETYNRLIADGYAEMTLKHFDRQFQCAVAEGFSPEEDYMYGDNMLALSSFWMLIDLEKDSALLETYRNAFKTWKNTLLREHNPGYDFIYKISCTDEKIDIEKDVSWFNRFEPSRLAASVNMNRHDVPLKRNRLSGKLSETSLLLMPDERLIKKYDHNHFEYFPNNKRSSLRIEGCYVYTFAYWIGRYYGFIAEED